MATNKTLWMSNKTTVLNLEQEVSVLLVSQSSLGEKKQPRTGRPWAWCACTERTMNHWAVDHEIVRLFQVMGKFCLYQDTLTSEIVPFGRTAMITSWRDMQMNKSRKPSWICRNHSCSMVRIAQYNGAFTFESVWYSGKKNQHTSFRLWFRNHYVVRS